MRRATVGTGIVASGLLLASLAHASIDLTVGPIEAASVPAPQFALDREGLLKRWITVGRCVVSHDRATAIAFARAPAGSDDALAAARRLDPVFVSCLAGSRVPGPSSVILRRAAVANALGMRNRT